MPNSKLQNRISKAQLTARETRTINKLIDNMSKTVFLSGQQMAAFCDISATSMTRLIQKLGYEKFGEFKDDFEEEYRATITPYDMFEDFYGAGRENSMVNESIRNSYANLNGMENAIDENNLYKIAELIANAEKVYIVGMYSSEVVVRAFSYYLKRLGKECIDLTGLGLINKFRYSDTQEGDVLIAVSTQRIAKEVLDCVLYAKQEKVISVAMTDAFTNPLANNADYVAVAPVKGLALDCTLVAILALTNIIANLVAMEVGELEEQMQTEFQKHHEKDLFCV